MRRLARLVLPAAAVLAFATACGGGSSSTATTSPSSTSPSASDSSSPSPSSSTDAPARGNADLVIWTDSQQKADAVKKVADQFGQQNGISVAVQVVSTDLQTAFVTADAAGNGPDVVMGAHDWIGNLVQNGAISPLQLTAQQLNGYLPISVQAATYNGQLYGLPWDVETVALYRNTAIAPHPVSSLDQAISEGQAAVKAGKAKVAFDLPVGTTGDAYHMEPLYTSMGGYMFGTKSDGQYVPTNLGIGKSGSIAAAKKIYSLGSKGSKVLSQSVDDTNNINLFAQGKAAFMVSGPWALATVNSSKTKYAIQTLPGFAGQKPATPFMGSQVFMVAGHAKNAAFAQQFVSQAMNTPSAMLALAKSAQEPPAMKSVAAKISDPNIRLFAKAAESAAPMPSIPAMAAVWAPLGKAYAAIVAGADPTKTMEQTGQTIAKAIKSGN